MVRAEVLRRRLSRLRDNLDILERLRRYSREEFLADPERYGAAERFLQLSIEALNDVAAHVIADDDLGLVESSRDIPRLLREHALIDTDAERRWVQMIGFRNILVHEYLEVDRRVVHEVLQHRLGELRALGDVFARYL